MKHSDDKVFKKHPLELIEDQLIQILDDLEEEEFDFEEQTALYTWRYASKPNVFFQLAIGSLDEEEEVKEVQEALADIEKPTYH